jgi:PBP1b-binding outer membrane lipoprotein LpoB
VRAEDLERVAAEVVHALEGADAVRALEGRRPLLVVGRVRNGTREPVDTQALADRLASGLARTGRFTLQGAGEREAVAEEEAAPGPRGAATPPPATPPSADYLLTGDVTSRVEGEGPEVRVSLWLAVALHDLRTGQVGWRDARVLRAGERPGPGGW